MIRQIHHVAILTNDIDAAINHYVDLIGCEKAGPIDVEKPGLRWRSVLLPIGNGTTALQLIQPLEGPGVEDRVVTLTKQQEKVLRAVSPTLLKS